MNRREFFVNCAKGAGALLLSQVPGVNALAEETDQEYYAREEKKFIAKTGIKIGEVKIFQVGDTFYRVSYSNVRGKPSLSIKIADMHRVLKCNDDELDGDINYSFHMENHG